MLTRLLLLSVIWLALSAGATFAAGGRLRRGSPALSALWLLAVVGLGAAAALGFVLSWAIVFVEGLALHGFHGPRRRHGGAVTQRCR